MLCEETFKECTTQCKDQADFKLQYHALEQYILILIALGTNLVGVAALMSRHLIQYSCVFQEMKPLYPVQNYTI